MSYTLSKKDSKLTKARNIAGITMGNAIEFYDFAIYGTFAVLLGKLFFPGTTDFERLIFSFATLGVGFITRPLGAILIGLYADRYGRKPALMLTLWLMAAGTVLFVVTPTYEQIGIAATLIILFARLLQGFALGGELGASTTMLMEYADNSNRAFYGSWQMFGQALNTLLASCVGVGIGFWLQDDVAALESWGWRLAFAVGLVIIPMALYIRRTLPETHTIKEKKESSKDLLKLIFNNHRKELAAGFLMILGSTVPVYLTLFYFANFSIAELKVDFRYGVIASCIAAFIQLVSSPIVGKLADKHGRKPMIFISRAIYILAIYPIFMLITTEPSLFKLYTSVGLLSLVLTFNVVPSLIVCAEIFPSKIRTTGLSLVYSITVAIFGGFAQMIMTWLIKASGTQTAPAFYVIVMMSLSLVGLLLFKETANTDLQ